LPPAELVHLLEAREGKAVSMLTVQPDSTHAAKVWFTPPPGERRGQMRYFDPYTGDYLGDAVGQDFFGIQVGSADHRATGCQGIGQGAAGNLVFPRIGWSHSIR